MMLSLDEFRATKREVPSLEAEGVDDTPNPGLMYADGCWIEQVDHVNGKYHLLIETSEWYSDDLAELEGILYNEWYVHEYAD